MAENKNSSRIGVYIGNELLSRCDAAIPKTNASSRSEFICGALEHYLAVLNARDNSKVLTPALESVISGKIAGTEERLSRIIFKLAAEHPTKPNAYAQFQLGRMCAENPEEAEKWYRLAYQGFLRIEQKLPDDKLYYRLGAMNLHGLGTEKNLEKAEMYFNKAAILGNVDAVYGMDKLYLEIDPEKSIRYFELAAKQGHTYAEYQLGKIYCFGIDIPRDLETSMEWLRLSAEHGNEHAASLLQHVKDHLAESVSQLAFSLLAHFAQMIRNDGEHQYRVRLHTDSKLKSKIAEKKRLHGQKHQEEYQGMQL